MSIDREFMSNNLEFVLAPQALKIINKRLRRLQLSPVDTVEQFLVEYMSPKLGRRVEITYGRFSNILHMISLLFDSKLFTKTDLYTKITNYFAINETLDDTVCVVVFTGLHNKLFAFLNARLKDLLDPVLLCENYTLTQFTTFVDYALTTYEEVNDA